MRGRWRIVELPGYAADYADMAQPAYISLDATGGDFAFGCLAGGIHGGADPQADAIQFTWEGSDEMDDVAGDGWAELQPNGSLMGEIAIHHGDDITFLARPWTGSSTAC